nr:hypothetical protein [uncultured Fluviicola sp.]
MKPQPMITVRFVKRLLSVLIGAFLLSMIFPGFATILGSIFIPVITVVVLVFQAGFPKTEITVDEETICFKRNFPSWYPLSKYYMHELTVPHADWDNWIKIVLSGEDSMHYYYLFLKDQRLRFAAETLENADLEYWIQKKFPDRPLQLTRSFKKYRDCYENLKEKNRMKVF